MSARMPIATALLQGRHMAYMGPVLERINYTTDRVIAVQPIENRVAAKVLGSLHHSVPFDIQMASELYWGQRKEYYLLERDFQSLRLPYPAMWCEWAIPATGYRQGKRYSEDRPPARFAAHVWEEEVPPNARGADRVITMQFLAESQQDQPPGTEKPILLSEMPVKLCVDSAGRYIDGTYLHHVPDGLRPKTIDMLKAEATSTLFTVAMALQLVNCRNVTTAKAGNIAVRRSGREKRQGVAPVAFHTIVLPGMTVERGKPTRRAQAANEAMMRQHMVRGHFKHFTKEAPLLGRHVGTYWWSPTVRGNSKRGKVVQDYQIGATS